MRRRDLIPCTLVLLGLLGCEPDKDGTAEATAPAAGATKEPAKSAAPKPDDAKETPTATPTPTPTATAAIPTTPPTSAPPPARVDAATGLPPVDYAPAPKDRAAEAKRLNKEGLGHYKAARWSDAAASLRAAVAADPGHVLARYNLASVYARSGDEDKAIAVLQQFADDGSPVSLGRLLATRRDEDWKTLRKDPRVRALVEGVDKTLPSIDDAAKAVQGYLTKPKGGVPAIINRRMGIERLEIMSTCDPEGGIGCRTKTTMAGTDDLAAWIKEIPEEWFNGLETEGAIKCGKECCDVKAWDEEFGISHNTLYLERMCFRVDAGVAVRLTKLQFLDGA